MTFKEFKNVLSLLTSSDKQCVKLGKELLNIENVDICDWNIISVRIGFIIQNNIYCIWSDRISRWNFWTNKTLTEKEVYDYIWGL